MAGSSTNWFKNPKIAKGRVFVSNATLESAFPGTAAAIKEFGRRHPSSFLPEVVSLAEQSPQPGGQAKKKSSPPVLPTPPPTRTSDRQPRPIENPPGWAQDAVASALVAYQDEINGHVVYYDPDSPAEQALNAAFVDTNPGVSQYNVETKADIDFFPSGYRQLANYQQAHYTVYNYLLWRRGSLGADNSITMSDTKIGDLDPADDIAALQDFVIGLRTPVDMTLTRAASKDHVLYRWASGVEVGAVYTSMGFDSSSTNPNISVHGSDVKIRMRVPSGARAAAVNALLSGGPAKETEWLMPANSSWVVSGKKVVGDQIELVVDLVDQRQLNGSIVWP